MPNLTFSERLIQAMVKAGFTKNHSAEWFKKNTNDQILDEKDLDQVGLADAGMS